MPKSKKTQTAITWLESGEAPQERSAEVVGALILLAHDLPLEARLEALGEPNLGPDVEMAMLVLAQRAEALELMVHLRDHGQHKATAKQAKKCLYRAKQRGADVPTDDAPSRAVRLARRPDPLPSYCSTFDREGGQVVVLGGWDEEHGAWALVGIVHGELGLNTVAWLPKMSRSRLKTVLESLAGERSEALVEVDSAFAAGRLKWALCHAEASSRRIEGDRSRVRRVLQHVEPLEDFYVDKGEPDDAALAQSAALLEDTCFETWLLSLAPLLDAAGRALTTAARAGELEATQPALMEGLCAHAESWFDGPRRRSLAERMQITAMLFSNLKRDAMSAAAYAVAHALASDEASIADIPLFRAAFERDAPIEQWQLACAPAPSLVAEATL